MQIKNFAQIEGITEFELTKHEGKHSRLNFAALISEGAAEKFLAFTGKNISVTTDNNAPIFFGRVESVEVENLLGASKVFAECVSSSISEDGEVIEIGKDEKEQNFITDVVIHMDTVNNDVRNKAPAMLAKIEIHGAINSEVGDRVLKLFEWSKELNEKKWYRTITIKAKTSISRSVNP